MARPFLSCARHAEMERLDAAQHEPGVERTRHRSGGVVNELQARREIIVDHCRHSADHIAVSVQILRCRVKDDVGAEREGLLEKRRGERVVDDEQRLMRVGDLRRGCEIRDLHERIRRRLDEYGLRLRRARILDALHVRRVHVREAEAQMLQQLVEQPERSAVHVRAADNVIAGLEKFHDRVEAAHAARERESMLRPFERSDRALERLTCGILSARVFVSLVLAQPLLHVRRGEIHRRHDRSGQRILPLARVDGTCAERGAAIVIEYACHTCSQFRGPGANRPAHESPPLSSYAQPR